MMSQYETIDRLGVASVSCPLQQFITQRWSELLIQQRLEAELQLAAQTPRVRCEIFIGDEFKQAGTLHVDVVIKLQPNAFFRQDLPTVLVFEKHSLRLVQQELNGLQLETPVLTRLAL